MYTLGLLASVMLASFGVGLLAALLGLPDWVALTAAAIASLPVAVYSYRQLRNPAPPRE